MTHEYMDFRKNCAKIQKLPRCLAFGTKLPRDRSHKPCVIVTIKINTFSVGRGSIAVFPKNND